jgi:hypothetical protein
MPNMIELYCKIPNTERTGIFNIRDDLTISELLHYINTKVRLKLRIPSRYTIEVVDVELGETGCKIENSYVETIRERYGNNLFNDCLVYYLRIIDYSTESWG